MAKQSLKERLKARRKKIEENSNSSNIFFPKVGSTRFRVLPVGEENEFGIPVLRPFFGKGITSFTSSATFGDDCPVQEAYKEAKVDGDSDLAKQLSLKTKYFIAVILYKDERGKEVDTDTGVTLMQVSGGIYSEMIDNFLDPDWGDFTDVENGYDLNIKRTGSGKTDTKYTLTPKKNTPTPKGYTKEINLEAMVKATTVEYSVAEERLAEFLESIGSDFGDDDEPKKVAKTKKSKKVKRPRKGGL